MRRLLFGAECVEHARSGPPHSECHEQAQSQPEQGADGRVGGQLRRGAAEGVAVRLLEVVLHVLLCELGELIPAGFAEGREGVARHCDGGLRDVGWVLKTRAMAVVEIGLEIKKEGREGYGIVYVRITGQSQRAGAHLAKYM